MAIRLLLVKAFLAARPAASGQAWPKDATGIRQARTRKSATNPVAVIVSSLQRPVQPGSGCRSDDLRCGGTPRRSPAAPGPTSHTAPATAPAAADGRRPPRRSEPAPAAKPALMSHTLCWFPHHTPAPSAPILRSRPRPPEGSELIPYLSRTARGARFEQRSFRAQDLVGEVKMTYGGPGPFSSPARSGCRGRPG
jgi:hypothetical protein